MKILEQYSHLNGYEFILVHKPEYIAKKVMAS